ncbi:MAG: helix-turn-helix domain-containing protein [Gemmiger formicilis]|uniref:helix-turn-helix domain-containing protein n=1 Tax=Gemmiger formicilis TaxID=745368 RepID=UPI003FED7864|nr:helix-turn-helix domain-containing protein [Gemmiger formicilis]
MKKLNKRIKMVRKSKGLTLEKFGERIGITASACSTIENGKNNASDQTIRSICREFNVSENWLRTGEGEMYNAVDEDEEISNIMTAISANDPVMVRILKAYWHLTPDERRAFQHFVDNVVEEYKKNNPE